MQNVKDVKYFLAIDIGASSGRHILSHAENGKVVLEEIYRFENGAAMSGAHMVWDTEKLFSEIQTGIAKCAAIGKKIESLGIDTWGVDYVILDKAANPLLPVFAYRDAESAKYTAKVEEIISTKDLYHITGIPPQPFNTIYQLLRDKESGKLQQAQYMLMLPEYFSYRLLGEKDFAEYVASRSTCEYTNASTTGLIDAEKRIWSYELIEKLALPKKLFLQPKLPPYTIGTEKTTGANIVMVASHDTASAVSVLQGDENVLYISSGTWSLLGVQIEPVLTAEALQAGYANEGAASGKIRFLKNIMGLWMIQSVRHELGDKYSFAELENDARAVAASGKYNTPQIDVNSTVFLNPPSMIKAIQEACKKNLQDAQKVPESTGEIALCIYENLSRSYAQAIGALENITGKTYNAIRIIGGGSKDTYLNELTQKASGKKVVAGPAEATALGNILRQMEEAGINVEELNV